MNEEGFDGSELFIYLLFASAWCLFANVIPPLIIIFHYK